VFLVYRTKGEKVLHLNHFGRFALFAFIFFLFLSSTSSSKAADTSSPYGYGEDVPFGGFVQPPSVRRILSNTLVGRYNPLGLFDEIRLGMQKALYRRDAAFLRDNFLYTGLQLKFIPTSIKVGAALEIQPLSIFNLRTTIEWMRYFTTFNSFQSFASPQDDYSDSTLSKRTDDDLSYSTSGFRSAIEPSLQFRLPVGKKKAFGSPLFYIALRDKFCAEYDSVATRQNDTVWYDTMLDTLVPADGWTFQNHLDLLVITRINLTVGARYTLVYPIYKRSDFRDAKEADAYSNDNGHQRVGPVIAFTLFDRAYARFNRPTFLFVANWYVDHRWRNGTETSAAIPYMLLAFSFQSDFLNGPPLP
jgi:hypothetical protein